MAPDVLCRTPHTAGVVDRTGIISASVPPISWTELDDEAADYSARCPSVLRARFIGGIAAALMLITTATAVFDRDLRYFGPTPTSAAKPGPGVVPSGRNSPPEMPDDRQNPTTLVIPGQTPSSVRDTDTGGDAGGDTLSGPEDASRPREEPTSVLPPPTIHPPRTGIQEEESGHGFDVADLAGADVALRIPSDFPAARGTAQSRTKPARPPVPPPPLPDRGQGGEHPRFGRCPKAESPDC